MRPRLRFLSDELVEEIVAEAREILCKIGVDIDHAETLTMLSGHGARIDAEKNHVWMTEGIIDSALKTAPGSFALYDVMGEQTHDFSGDNVHFTPGSTAIHVLDSDGRDIRCPDTDDYIRYVKTVSRLPNLASQSTALIPQDVPEQVSDSYRLYLSLLHGEKPVVTGTFSMHAFEVMKELQIAVRGSLEGLVAKPLTVFSCCATAPLQWSRLATQNVVDCAAHGIPVELIAMPLAGFVAPVTLVGTLVQHTAEVLGGLVISQLTNPGAPMLYGGSPAIFDVRYETTPMGAVESMMICCAYNEIGKHLGVPTQAYIGLSDAKMLDAQAGLETSMGATLAVLAGINNISGPGMHDFESCFSLEKLIVDHEICGMTRRLIRGIEPKEDFPIVPRIEELLAEQHLLISKHTRKYLRDEHHFPGPVIDRANRSRWTEEGSLSLRQRANMEVKSLLSEYEPSRLPDTVKGDLTAIMSGEARRHEMDQLPISAA